MSLYPSRVIAIDFETLGLIANYDSPTSLDAIVFEDGEPTGEALSLKIRPSLRSKISLEAFAVQAGGEESAFDPEKLHEHIKRIFPADAIPAKQAMILLDQWGREVGAHLTPNIAQRASFDHAFFDQQLANWTTVYKGHPLSPIWICTKTMGRIAFPEISKPSLATLALAIGIQVERTLLHDSKYDALLCGYVYFGLKDLLESRPGGKPELTLEKHSR